jgi:hypothetical protein
MVWSVILDKILPYGLGWRWSRGGAEVKDGKI